MLLALLALLAAGIDVALYASVADHYHRHRHIGLPLDLTAVAFAFTALAVYASISISKELRKRRGSRHAEKHDTHAGRGQSPKEPP
ncbi:MAG: hypothetical protein HBSAPP03_23040 [Phycisphaerae bacterium]|nr:MAG: hypothetical protein HBSAPP03_23040 [Phycisphaerae bacterium]